jgi:hypothetical protein
MSDRPSGVPTPDERMADARAVMDAAGLTSAHVLDGARVGRSGRLSRIPSGREPRPYGTQATFRRRDDYPFGDESDEQSEEWYAELESGWGTVDYALLTHPDADPYCAATRSTCNRLRALQPQLPLRSRMR